MDIPAYQIVIISGINTHGRGTYLRGGERERFFSAA